MAQDLVKTPLRPLITRNDLGKVREINLEAQGVTEKQDNQEPLESEPLEREASGYTLETNRLVNIPLHSQLPCQ